MHSALQVTSCGLWPWRTRPEQKHDRPCPTPREGTISGHWLTLASTKIVPKSQLPGQPPASRLEKTVSIFLRAANRILTGGILSLWTRSPPEKVPYSHQEHR